MSMHTGIAGRVLGAVLGLSLIGVAGSADAALMYDFEFVQGPAVVGTGNIRIAQSALDAGLDVSAANAEAPPGSKLVPLADLGSLSFTILGETWVLADATTFTSPTTTGVEGVLLAGDNGFLQFLDAQLAPADFDTIGVEFGNSTPAILQFLDSEPLGWTVFGPTGSTVGTGDIGSVGVSRVPGPGTLASMLLGLAMLVILDRVAPGRGATRRAWRGT